MEQINETDTVRISELFPCFSELTNMEWAMTRKKTIDPAYHHAIHEGHKLQHAVFVLSGSIRICKISDSGKEVTLYRVRSGECCVLMMASILGEMEYEGIVHIEMETEIFLVPVEIFRNWMSIHKPIQLMIYKQFVLRWTEIANLLEKIAFNSISRRILDFLQQSQDYFNGADQTITITHEQLAIELGTSREVVSRTLKSFTKKGAIILQRGKIRIVDLKKMNI